jgi:SAM-dependent methyltransferase
MKLVLFALSYLGIDPKKAFTNFKGLFWYIKDISIFNKQYSSSSKDFRVRYIPVLTDKYDSSGKARGQYFYQDLYVANRIFEDQPVRHIDIGSRVDGFVAHVAAFRPIEVFDIRPSNSQVKNIHFVQADLMLFDSKLEACTDSLSCLHTIEHFGLGRYNDPIDIDGHLKGLDNMYRLLKPGGRFYFSTQIGPQIIDFNSHRIFAISYLLNYFKGKYEIERFSYIDDKDQFFVDAPLTDELIRTNAGCKMGCGIFVLKKI